jgi:hypothetical protein
MRNVSLNAYLVNGSKWLYCYIKVLPWFYETVVLVLAADVILLAFAYDYGPPPGVNYFNYSVTIFFGYNYHNGFK